MKRNSATSRSLLIAIALVGLSTATSGEEMYLVRDGVPIEKNIQQTDMDAKANPFWKDWTQRIGKTVDGRFVLDRRDKNLKDFPAPKSALGDCEFKVSFSVNPAEYGKRGGGRGPRIRRKDRGTFGFLDKGRKLSTSQYLGSLPLASFDAASPINLGDSKLHTMTVKRVGDVLSFLVDGKEVTGQKIDPKANLIFDLGAQESHPRVASIRFTADKFSDSLSTAFKSAAPIKLIFDGSGALLREIGQAFSYRIPALVVSKRGTLLAFAEARRVSKSDSGDIDLVLRRGGHLASIGQRVHLLNGDERKITGKTGDADEINASLKRVWWNAVVIRAEGNRLLHWLNGHLAVEAIDDDGAKSAKKGLLAFQLHSGPPMKIELKDIFLRHLNQTSKPAEESR